MNDEPFDSTYLRNKSFEFKLGNGEVVIGLDVAVATMKKKEKSQFIFNPEYYCGKHGCPPRVPANTPGKQLYQKIIHDQRLSNLAVVFLVSLESKYHLIRIPRMTLVIF